jgi:hypothetical protein
MRPILPLIRRASGDAYLTAAAPRRMVGPWRFTWLGSGD